MDARELPHKAESPGIQKLKSAWKSRVVFILSIMMIHIRLFLVIHLNVVK